MPNFTNDGTKRLHVIGIDGKKITVEPGDAFESYLRCEKIFPDVTLVGEDPYLEEVFRLIELTFTIAETQVITLTDEEVLEAKRIVMYAGGSAFTAEIRLNHASASIRRKIDIDRGLFGVTIELDRQVQTIRITSNGAGTLHAYPER